MCTLGAYQELELEARAMNQSAVNLRRKLLQLQLQLQLQAPLCSIEYYSMPIAIAIEKNRISGAYNIKPPIIHAACR
jgi:hypothetical protein